MFYRTRSRAIRNVLAVALLAATATAAPNRAQHITGIAHVALRVWDLSASLRFYRQLGLERAFEFTKDGAPSEEFLKINDRQFIELYPGKADQRAGLMHVCFELEDLDALRERYVQAGLNPPEIKRGGAGNDLFGLRRPDGAVIEFTQYQPGSMHMRDVGQHLGADRISDRLADVIEPVADPSLAVTFYQKQLGLISESGGKAEVRVPSSTAVRLRFVTPGNPVRLVFPVDSLVETKQALDKRGIHYRDANGEVVANDPDGDEVVFVGQ